MSDIKRDNLDYQAFSIWAFQMLKSGRCMIKHCEHHLHYEGPTAFNEHCRKCFLEEIK